jgi:23S rRNA maturation mini-RNase III
VVPRKMQYTGPTDYMLATAMEAVLGAIDVDSGEDALWSRSDSLQPHQAKEQGRLDAAQSFE